MFCFNIIRREWEPKMDGQANWNWKQNSSKLKVIAPTARQTFGSNYIIATILYYFEEVRRIIKRKLWLFVLLLFFAGFQMNFFYSFLCSNVRFSFFYSPIITNDCFSLSDVLLISWKTTSLKQQANYFRKTLLIEIGTAQLDGFVNSVCIVFTSFFVC